MLSDIKKYFGRISDRQKYIRDKVSQDNFTKIVSGETLNGEEPVQYLSGLEFILPEECSYEFTDRESDKWEVTLKSEGTSKQDIKDTNSEHETEWWSKVHSESFDYEVGGINPAKSHDANVTRHKKLDFGIENINGRQRIRIGLIDSRIDFPKSGLNEFKTTGGSTAEIRCSSYLKFLQDMVLEVELNGQTVIKMRFGGDEEVCSSSLGWQNDNTIDEIKLSRKKPIKKETSPAERFDYLE